MKTDNKEDETKCTEVIEEDENQCNCYRCRCNRNKEKRFKIGDRVIANMEVWCAGTVTEIDYREDNWEPERVSAYQILLDSECRFEQHYIHAPEDIDEYVRPMPKSTKALLYDSRKDIKCCGAGVKCPHFHVCDDTIKCPKYHFCGKRGKIKTAMWKKLAERDASNERKAAEKKNNNNNNNTCCQDGNCNDIREKSIDAILDFIGVNTDEKKQGRKKIKKKKKKKKKSSKIRKSEERQKKDEQKHQQDCECANCKAIAAQGRKAIIAMLRKGMDFSPLFKEDGPFDEIGNIEDMQKELALFYNVNNNNNISRRV